MFFRDSMLPLRSTSLIIALAWSAESSSPEFFLASLSSSTVICPSLFSSNFWKPSCISNKLKIRLMWMIFWLFCPVLYFSSREKTFQNCQGRAWRLLSLHNVWMCIVEISEMETKQTKQTKTKTIVFVVALNWKSLFEWLHKKPLKFLGLYVRGIIKCFFHKFLILQRCQWRSKSLRGFKITGMITAPLHSRIVNVFVLIAIYVRLNNSRFQERALCMFISSNEVTALVFTRFAPETDIKFWLVHCVLHV